MHTNVENVLERDRKLGDLEERADALQDGCAQFEKQAAAMKNKFWLENLKVKHADQVCQKVFSCSLSQQRSVQKRSLKMELFNNENWT